MNNVNNFGVKLGKIIWLSEKFLGKREISHKELVSLINGLMRYESFAAEEYLTVLDVKLIELMAGGKKNNLELLKRFLNG